MRVKVLAVALLTAVAVAVPTSAGASHSWGGYHWARTSNPFTLALGDAVSTSWDSYLAVASADWNSNQQNVLTTTVVPSTTNPKTCKATAGMVMVCNANYGNTNWLGIASIWLSGGHISQGTVKLNDTYFNTTRYNTPAWRALVTCQEIGHTFGLDHQDTNFSNANLGTCMDYTNDPSTNQHPNKHDYDQLMTIYSHLDTTTTVGAVAPLTGKAAVGNSAATWGRLVEGSRASGHSTYVRHLPDGSMVVSFVSWA